MKRKLTTGGIVLLAVGGILTLAGLALFLREVLVLDPDLPDPLILPWWREINLEGGMLGLVLLVAGSYLVKIGLGLTLVGHADSISSWLHRLFRGEKGALECPNCGASVTADSKYCSQCGAKLKQNITR